MSYCLENYFTKFFICTIVVIILIWFNKNVFSLGNYENFVTLEKITKKIKWTQMNCKNNMGELLTQVLKDNELVSTKNDGEMYIPCSYNSINYEINTIINKKNNKNKYIYIIDNADQFAGKELFWINTLKLYGNDIASKLIPKTYVLYNQNDLKMFKTEYDKNTIYIIKKNIQRQHGLKITKNYNEIVNGINEGYVVAQILLQNPYLIYKRKTNMRFYTLVICNKGNIVCYVYNNGFMYYTPDNFEKNTLDGRKNITSGYIDRKIYEYSPLTHADFKEYLDNTTNRVLLDNEKKLINENKKISEHVFKNIYKTLAMVHIAQFGKICNNKNLDNDVTFQLFGSDIAVDDELNATIIEINKGPDLGPKSDKDRILKYNVLNDIFVVLGLINKSSHNYIKLCETIDKRITEEINFKNIKSDFVNYNN